MPGWIILVALAPLGILAWCAIVDIFGWLPFFVLTYLYLLLGAAIVSVGGINAALLWIERRSRR